jgi:ABC-type multidrug transport system ATPase subunit
MSTPALELRSVTKSYADRVALDDVSLAVERGELVALVGANGAGKSTLLQLAVGLLDATSGDVLVEGAAAGSLDARRSLSYISDQPSLYDDLTVNEHIEYVSRLHGGEARPDAADELLGLLNLTARADDLPARFSRGLRQKTVGLDPAGQDSLADLLTAAADAGCAVLVATHQLAFLERTDRCVALRDGAIAYRGPVDREVIDPLLD